ncbi:hypothetical protein SEVIR_5G121550v4 [Setaria viridis]
MRPAPHVGRRPSRAPPPAGPAAAAARAQRRGRPSPLRPRLPTVAARICPRRRPLPPPGRRTSPRLPRPLRSCLPLIPTVARRLPVAPRRRVPELVPPAPGARSVPPAGPPPAPFSIARRRRGWCFSSHSNWQEAAGKGSCFCASVLETLPAYRHCHRSSDAAQSSPQGKSSQAPGQTGMQRISVTDGWVGRG